MIHTTIRATAVRTSERTVSAPTTGPAYGGGVSWAFGSSARVQLVAAN